MNLPLNGYRNPNKCPYCGYLCDSAEMLGYELQPPIIGDLSLCFMCCEVSQFNSTMQLEKFEINSIKSIVDRNRLKIMQVKMRQFWEENNDTTAQEKRKPYCQKKEF